MAACASALFSPRSLAVSRSFACRFVAHLALALPFTVLFACSAGTGAAADR
jgi:hypothetical protein